MPVPQDAADAGASGPRTAAAVAARGRASAGQLALVAEHTRDGVCLLDAQKRPLWVNDAFVALTGYGPSELQVDGMCAALAPAADADPAELGRLESAFATGTAADVLYATHRKDGAAVTLRLVATPVLAADGALRQWVVGLTDLTEHRRREAATRAQLEQLAGRTAEVERRARDLEAAEARLRTVLDTMTEGVVVQAAGAGAIVDWNPAAEQILRLTGDQLAGRTSLDPLWRTVQRDGTPMPGSEHPAMRVLATGEPTTDLFGVHTPDGTLRWVSVRAAPIREPGTGTVTAAVATFTDVTDSTEVQASHALTAAGVGTWTWYPATDTVRWSAALGPLLGRPLGWAPASFAEFLGLVHDEDRPGMRATLDAALRDGTPYAPTYRVRWPDGTWHWLQGGDAWVERDDAGTVRRMDGAVWDITALEESRRAQAASEARLSLIHESTSDLLFLVAVERAPDGRVTDFRCESVNTAYRLATGLADGDVIGRTLEEVHPPGAAALGRTHYEAAVRTGTVQRYDDTVELPAGRILVETALTPVRDATGTITHVLGSARDVTALRSAQDALHDSEARYRALVEASPDGVFVHGRGTILYANAAGARLLGAPDASALVGRRLLDFVVPEERDDLIARVQAGATSGAYGTAEHTLVRIDTGERVPVEISAARVVIRDAGTPIDAVQATLRDVSERRRAEAERRELEHRLQHAQKLEAVGQLAGGLAHDLNNLLCIVSGNRDLAEDELEGAHPARVLLGEMGDAVDRARRLVRSLLTFSRREVVQAELLDVVDIVRGFAPLLRTALEERVALRLVLPPHALPLVADRSHLEQVLMNLVVNARDAILSSGRAPAGGTITVSLAEDVVGEDGCAPGALLRPGKVVALVVADDGPGMDEATAARATEPFFTTKPVGAGTGLGLATVLGIVQRMQGELRIESRPGAGTRVTVLLPLETTPTATAAPVSAALPPAPESGPTAPVGPAAASPSLHGTTVLLVEDEESVRSLARRLLEREGTRVLEASHGRDALEVWASHRDEIGVVVSDVRMPVMDGVALAHRLRAEQPDLPLVLMSGYTDGAPVHEWTERLAFVPKPFGAHELLGAVREVLA